MSELTDGVGILIVREIDVSGVRVSLLGHSAMAVELEAKLLAKTAQNGIDLLLEIAGVIVLVSPSPDVRVDHFRFTPERIVRERRNEIEFVVFSLLSAF